MVTLVPFRGAETAPQSERSKMDTLILTPDQVNSWHIPPFQRPVRVNSKVQAIAEEIRCDGVSIVGILTLGKLKGDTALYLVDGQHRIEAFRLSGLEEIIADVRVIQFDSMSEMAEEFVRLNTAIVRMRPDDLLRGLSPTMPNLQRVMRECQFVGYDQIRRGGVSGSLVSLSAVLRYWQSSSYETPTSSSGGMSITQIATMFDGDEAAKLIRFLHLAVNAWGRDPEYYRLWGNLNLCLCMWLYRRVVLDTVRRGSARVAVLTESQFKQGLMSLSANSDYLDWLTGRLLSDRDRSPALARIKASFTRRLADTLGKFNLPQPAWSARR